MTHEGKGSLMLKRAQVVKEASKVRDPVERWNACLEGSVGWSQNRVKFQKMIYSSFLHECTKKEGFPTSRGLNLKTKP